MEYTPTKGTARVLEVHLHFMIVSNNFDQIDLYLTVLIELFHDSWSLLSLHLNIDLTIFKAAAWKPKNFYYFNIDVVLF